MLKAKGCSHQIFQLHFIQHKCLIMLKYVSFRYLSSQIVYHVSKLRPSRGTWSFYIGYKVKSVVSVMCASMEHKPRTEQFPLERLNFIYLWYQKTGIF